MTARCRSCNREIDWIKTVNGKNMPLDIGMVHGGNVVIGDDGLAHVITPDPTVRTFVSHFTTCPNATDHRKHT